MKLASPRLIGTLTLVFGFAITSTANAVIKDWDAGVAGAWTAATNWSGDTIPASGDSVQFYGTNGVITGSVTSVPALGNNSITLFDFKNGGGFTLTSSTGDSYTNNVKVQDAYDYVMTKTGGRWAINAGGTGLSADIITNGSLTYNGNLIGSGLSQYPLTKSGGGTLTLNNVTATQGGAPSLITMNGGKVVLNSVANFNTNGVISGISSAEIEKLGSFTMTLGGTAVNTFAGLVKVTAGTLALNKSGAGVAIAGSLGINGGTVSFSAGNQIANTSSVSMSSGTLALSTFSDTIGGFQMTGGSVTGTGTLTSAVSAFDLQAGSIAPILDGSVGLNKSTGGTVTLSGTNSYSGGTNISGGILALTTATTNNIATSPQIDIAGGATLDVTGVSGSGGFALASGQILSGVGTVTGGLTVASGAFIRPGASPGILTVNGDLSIAGTYTADLSGNTAGTGYDQLLLSTGTRNVSLSGTLDDNFTGSGWSSVGDKLWIVKNNTLGTLSGTFSNYATNGQTIGSYDGKLWQIWYGADFATNSLNGGNDVAVFAIPVPEPGTFAMLLFGGVMMFFIRRK